MWRSLMTPQSTSSIVMRLNFRSTFHFTCSGSRSSLARSPACLSRFESRSLGSHSLSPLLLNATPVLLLPLTISIDTSCHISSFPHLPPVHPAPSNYTECVKLQHYHHYYYPYNIQQTTAKMSRRKPQGLVFYSTALVVSLFAVYSILRSNLGPAQYDSSSRIQSRGLTTKDLEVIFYPNKTCGRTQ